MIKINTEIKDYELCNLCRNKTDIKLGFSDSEQNTTTMKICVSCTNELYRKLQEHVENR
jgi:hypothetical protein